ncbi:MAG: transcription-repair coupling factor, partial [Clostridia bacterium]|nr:transcription-repair coupling factor [Clostridia bacterium]
SSLTELKVGDYVVHIAHGIGVFEGIQKMRVENVSKDYIKIRYDKGGSLYVPVTQLDMVSKYVGAEEGNVKLNKLGGGEWKKTRSRVRAAVKDLADQLTKLYATRMATKGYAFSKDTDLQSNFEARFEYEETPDQLRCIGEIKRDMERAVPMDRLLCGDVGFGKTEVALRAAFKCMSEGRQVALLVPTTILASQHYETVLRRIGDLPLKIELLSRFVSPKKQERILKDLARGRVDMIVGTHRLISKDVQFKDLGLVIIDEEQRFGVAQKERLKELFPTVDVLTLSATPIPRTLNMAVSGLRDMSTIEEAPQDRYPVQTYVMEQNNSIIADAITKELRRGGQVYYLHNRVESIDACAARLKSRLPECRIATAHGQMSEDELSAVWRKLLEQEIDVLVCTTIIESGIDVPNANTIIIEDADRFGLAQLHQLRGRVGRSHRRAYAYICFRPNAALSEIAQKRLEAVRQFTEFGSGFQIAMRDLEIRGAGSILGGEQHGHLESVGYDMYLKMLADAVAAAKGEEVLPEKECSVDIQENALIPESYIKLLPARMGIYRRIADIRLPADAEDVIEELNDRFGHPPQAVLNLVNIALQRRVAAARGITEIIQKEGRINFTLEIFDAELLYKFSERFKGRVKVMPGTTPILSIRLVPGDSPLAVLTAALAEE